MRKYIFVFIFLFLVTFTTYSENVYLGTFEYGLYNDLFSEFSDEMGNIFYDTEEKEVSIFFSDFLLNYAITTKNIPYIIAGLEKYIKWYAIATDSEETLEKDISTLSDIKAFFKIEDWEYAGNNNELTLSFFSQNPSWHQLVFQFNNFISVNNEYISYRPESLYLEKDVVENIIFLLSRENINNKIKEHQEKLKSESKYQ